MRKKTIARFFARWKIKSISIIVFNYFLIEGRGSNSNAISRNFCNWRKMRFIECIITKSTFPIINIKYFNILLR